MDCRYARQIVLPEIGAEGQARLLDARVVLVGVGGVGCATAAYLAGAGIGNLCLIDFDRVEITNLQRQVLYSGKDISSFKAKTAMVKLSALNPEINISSVVARVDDENVDGLIDGYDFVLAATDNLAAKILLNRACIRKKKKFFVGSACGFSGQVFSYFPGSACLGCFFPGATDAPEFKDETNGIIGAVAGVAGSLLASLAINSILELKHIGGGRLTTFDARTMRFHGLERDADPDCPLCGTRVR